jgi:hypothetical protein
MTVASELIIQPPLAGERNIPVVLLAFVMCCSSSRLKSSVLMLSEAVLIKWFVEKLRNFEAAKEDSAKIHEVFDVEKNDVTLIDCMKFQQVRSLAHGGATN